MKLVSISGIVSLVGIISIIGHKFYSEQDKRNNLSPGSFWVGGSMFEAQYKKAFLKNKDLDDDGTYETVIRYLGPSGEYQELQIIMDENGRPKIIY